MEIVLNSNTREKIAQVQRTFPHAVLLAGERGVGLSTIARYLAGNDLVAFIEPLSSKDELDSETGTISVATIRRLYNQSRAKSSSRRVFILDNAHLMSAGAQAAFLKLLEEPPENVHFILTSHRHQTLLPTIKSRLQTIVVEPISTNQTKELLDNHNITDPQTRRQLEYLASGLPAELKRLIGDDAYFKERAEVMTDTRTLLTGSMYDRLLVVHKYHQDRSNALRLIYSALMVTRHRLSIKSDTNVVTQLNSLLFVRENVEANCSIRLQLMSFVVQ